MDLNAALKWLSAAVTNQIGHSLKEPDLVILRGTWRGLTYEQMADSSAYSTNYLMRDVAPKLWKQLSNVFGRSVGKTNFRVALEAYAAAHSSDMAFELAAASSEAKASQSHFSQTQQPQDPETGLYWHPSVLPSPPAMHREMEGHHEAANRVSMPTKSAAVMYGYQSELTQLEQWITRAVSHAKSTQPNHSNLDSRHSAYSVAPSATGQIVGIWGLKGVGKTLLAKKAIDRVGDRFEGTVWRSLQSQPSLNELSASILNSFGITASAQASAQLLTLMAQRSLLIILEDIETILTPGTLAGSYSPKHQAYGKFFQAAIDSRSCIVLTGIEGPTELSHHSSHSNVHALALSQLSNTAATQLLQTELSNPVISTKAASATEIGFSKSFDAESFDAESFKSESFESENLNSENLSQKHFLTESRTDPRTSHSIFSSSSEQPHWPALINRYQNHPLAIKSACRIIQTIFNGQIDVFLQQTSVLLTDVLRVIAPSFNRLTTTEKDILYWIASQSTPSSLAALKEIPLSISSAQLISVLDSLQQRSLLNVDTTLNRKGTLPTFSLPPLVKAYAIHQFISCFSEQAIPSSPPSTAELTKTLAAPGVTPRVGHSLELSSLPPAPIPLSQWSRGYFAPTWQSLDHLITESAHPTIRLRNVYPLHSSFIKRYKLITLNAKAPAAKTESATKTKITPPIQAALIVAIQSDTKTRYRLRVQAQPAKADHVLSANFTLTLLNTQQKVLATVAAQQTDTFIQLPYFQGNLSESFSIELTLGDRTHTETFLI